MTKTTIAVSYQTYRALKALKEKWGMTSYDQVVQRVVRDKLNTPESLAGAFPDLG